MDKKDSQLVQRPRFHAENLEENKALYLSLAVVAKSCACTPSQLTLAWIISQGEDIVPIPGTTKNPNFNENIGSLQVQLDQKLVEEVAAVVPKDAMASGRYYEQLLKMSWEYADTPPLESGSRKST